MIHVKGISNNFSAKVDLNEIVYLWFKEIDILYFSNQLIIIELNEKDKEIIKNSKDCFEKLQVLSFKKNVKIKNI